MLRQFADIGAGNWLALLAIGFLAMGAPLAHPFLHDHHGRADHHVNESGPVIQAAQVDAIEHDCLICYLLGAGHDVASNSSSTNVVNMPVGSRMGGDPVWYGRSSTTPIIPRAPPFCSFYPTA